MFKSPTGQMKVGLHLHANGVLKRPMIAKFCARPEWKSKVKKCAPLYGRIVDSTSSNKYFSTFTASELSSRRHPGLNLSSMTSLSRTAEHPFGLRQTASSFVLTHKRKVVLLSDIQHRYNHSSQDRYQGGKPELSGAWKHFRDFGAGSFILAGVIIGAGVVYLMFSRGEGHNFTEPTRSSVQGNGLALQEAISEPVRSGIQKKGLSLQEAICEPTRISSVQEKGLSLQKAISEPARSSVQKKGLSLQEAIEQATDLCQRVKDEAACPGLVAAVSVDGQLVWAQGLGFADVENRVPCGPRTVMRIASISKAITMAAVAKAMETGDLDIDKPVQFYVPHFPEKTVDGEKVTVTTRHLVSHLSGIRHYSKEYFQPKAAASTTETTSSSESDKQNPSRRLEVTGEFDKREHYIKDKLESTDAALALFKDDPLVHKPDSKFLYTTHGWTLVAAVLEGATKQKFGDILRQLFRDLGLEKTYLDENEPVIYHRSRFYVRNNKGRMENAPYVDCSYKYAGGGMLSTVTDLLQFGNTMLYSYQCRGGQSTAQNGQERLQTQDTTTSGTHAGKHSNLPGYLRAATMDEIWTPVDKTQRPKTNAAYAMGWEVTPEKAGVGSGRGQMSFVYHTGGAVGASSILLILPSSAGELPRGGNSGELRERENSGELREGENLGDLVTVAPLVLPKGVTVAIFVNMIGVGLSKTAFSIARLFEQVSLESVEK